MDNYVILIWESQPMSKEYGPRFEFNNIPADSPEIALRNVMQENNLHQVFYAEVRRNDGHDFQKFENYSL